MNRPAQGAERLYTPAMLAAAVELAQWPPLPDLPCHGDARSAACGSTLALDLALGPEGAVQDIGLRVRACAVGQAAASVFARHVRGRSPAELAQAHDSLVAWLEQGASPPDWPDLDLIAPAREFRGRHGAMLLPWKAALAALSSLPAPR